jgi:subtilisin-like proprotein convertase family protein/Ca2+-binding EF-hand superfamily protein
LYRLSVLFAASLAACLAMSARAQTPPTPRFDSPPGGASVPGFGPVENLPPVPGFGEGSRLLIQVEQADIEKAISVLRRYDRNRDGAIDQAEAESGRWYGDPFQYDVDGDKRLNRDELATRYATRRAAEANPSSRGSSSRTSPESESEKESEESDEERRRKEEEQRRRSQYWGNREIWGLVDSLLRRYDQNRNRTLDQTEWRNMGSESAPGDSNGDGRSDRGELYRWLSEQKESAGPPILEGLPDWFGPRDRDGDGQIMMSEFAEEWNDEEATEFARFDLNNDGVIVPEECLKAAGHRSGTYASEEFHVIPARGTVYSRILVQDDQPIADLDVQLSITHTHDDYLDVFLIDPAGQRIELFTGVGGHDDHFDNTILDDDASVPIVRARPPFSGRYQTEAFIKRQPSLGSYRGSSIEGTWTLMVRAERSDRAGSLHGWALIAKPLADADSPEETAPSSDPSRDSATDDGPGSNDSAYRRDGDSPGRYGGPRPDSPRYGDYRREGYRRWPPSGQWSGQRGRED